MKIEQKNKILTEEEMLNKQAEEAYKIDKAMQWNRRED